MSQSDSHSAPLIGMIGGSGLYDMEGLSNTQWLRVESAFGEPSDELLFGEIDGNRIVFLPRHGRGHKIPPSQINYRATDRQPLACCGSGAFPPGTRSFRSFSPCPLCRQTRGSLF